jgi:vacuolar-type H+-ATPase subunit C/Vma6
MSTYIHIAKVIPEDIKRFFRHIFARFDAKNWGVIPGGLKLKTV